MHKEKYKSLCILRIEIILILVYNNIVRYRGTDQTPQKRSTDQTEKRRDASVRRLQNQIYSPNGQKVRKTMKAFYFENNGYNGILLTSGDKWISYDEKIDGIEIERDNIPQIVESLTDYGYDSDDFDAAYEQAFGTLVCGDGVEDALNEQDYSEMIYEK